MEVRPTKADITQFVQARDGTLVTIENDVQNVANSLHEIDPHLRLRHSEAGGYFVVYWLPDGEEEGNGDLITTAQELDQRIVHEVREIYHRCSQPGYSFADELEKRDVDAKKAQDAEWLERHGETYQRLAHAIRKDLGIKKRVFVPADVSAL